MKNFGFKISPSSNPIYRSIKWSWEMIFVKYETLVQYRTLVYMEVIVFKKLSLKLKVYILNCLSWFNHVLSGSSRRRYTYNYFPFFIYLYIRLSNAKTLSEVLWSFPNPTWAGDKTFCKKHLKHKMFFVVLR